MRILAGKSWGCFKETQLKIHRTLIKPFVLYGATATHGSRAVEKLNQVQYKALMTATGAIRGTALSALQVHCGEKPLDLSRLEHILKYTARIKYYAQKIPRNYCLITGQTTDKIKRTSNQFGNK